MAVIKNKIEPLIMAILYLAFAGTAFANPVSDDFHHNNINASLWTIVDPQNDSTFSIDSSRLKIQVPGGKSHDNWGNGNLTPRLMQAITNSDFDIIAKFESLPSQQYQFQGILIEEDSTNYIRFDLYSDGSSTNMFVGNIVNDTPQIIANINVSVFTPVYLRVTRTSNTFNYSYSLDNSIWVPVASATRAMAVSATGVFAGNAGNNPPAHSMLVDFFYNSSDSLIGEDSGSIIDTSPPYLYRQNVLAADNFINVQLATDESSQSTINYGLTTAYEIGSITSPTYSLSQALDLTGLSPDTTYHLQIVAEDNLGNIFQSGDISVTTLASGATLGPNIDVWYGDNQTFGDLGVPQQWINILGNTSDPDGVQNLQYSLNGLPYVQLSIGPDNRRLLRNGDFNIELDYTELLSGSNSVDIVATDSFSFVTTQTVTFNFTPYNIWPLPYAIDWSNVTNIQDVAQIVDGKWSIENSTVRTSETGYDRLIAIGDLNWHDFEIEVPVTINGVDPSAPLPGVGVLLRWPGHYDWDASQPRFGWWPMGALGWYRYRPSGEGTDKLRIVGGTGSVVAEDLSGKKLTTGSTYIFKMQVLTPEGEGSWYRLKVWENGTPEPVSWDLETQESIINPQNGSVLLLAHHVDASFGNVSITPLGTSLPNEPANITNINVLEGNTSATISWTTDRPTDSVINFGLDNSYGNVINDSTFVINHSLTLANLTPGTNYHYQISGSDTRGLLTTSLDQNFNTTLSTATQSDTFDNTSLGNNWLVVNPIGDGAVSVNGAQLVIDVPTGNAHDVWGNDNNTVRITQATADVDFETEIKFDSVPNSQYQLQGLLVEQDASNFLRFDFYHDGGALNLFAASFVNGSPTVQSNITVADGQPLYMRIKRVGNLWTQSYSYDGLVWNTAVSFNFAMTTNNLSIFAGNAGGNPPAFQLLVDHFLVAEGTLPIEDTIAPVINNLQISTNSTEATVSWQTNEPASTLLNYGLTNAYELGQMTEATLNSSHSILLSGLTEGSTYHLQINATDAANNTTTSTDISFIAEAPQPPVISNISVSANDTAATITWTTDKPADSVIDYGLDTTYGSLAIDANLTSNHSLILSGLTPEVTYHFQISGTDTLTLTTTSVDQMFTTTATPTVITAQSDTFDTTTLGSNWSVINPQNDGAVSVNGAQLVIDVPAGTSHDVWSSGNNAVRISQATADIDFEAEIKFDSAPNSQYQLQGLLVEQDASNFLRFDFYHNGSALNIFAASFINGSPTVQSNIIVTDGQPLYMRIKREGNLWTQSYSYDGLVWNTTVSFNFAMTTNNLSIFAGNAGGNPPAFELLVNHFLVAEGTLPIDDTIAPVISNLQISTNSTEATVTWQTNEPASTLLNYGLTNAYELGQMTEATLNSSHSILLPGLTEGSTYHLQINATDAANNTTTSTDISFIAEAPQPPVISNISVSANDTAATITWTTDKPADSVIDYGLDTTYGNLVIDANLTTNHSLTLSGLTPEATYHFQISGTDTLALTTTSVDQMFTTTATPTVITAQSDTFDTTTLGSNWSIIDPQNDGAVSVNGAQLIIDVPAGTSHDVWSSGNNAVRIAQATADIDFEAEIKFDSAPNSQYQLQGLLVEQDASNFLRFDFYHDGGALNLFAASFVNGSPSVQSNIVITDGQPLYMRIKREGNLWTQSYSYDGLVWNTAVSFNFAMTTNNLSIFAGNAGGSPPAFQAMVDHLTITNF